MQKITLFVHVVVILCYACKEKEFDIEEGCPDEIKKMGYCEIYAEAKWMFYASNIYTVIQYLNYQDRISKINMAEIDVKCNLQVKKNELVFYFVPDYEKFNLWEVSSNCRYFFCGLMFNKSDNKLHYRIVCKGDISYKIYLDKNNPYSEIYLLPVTYYIKLQEKELIKIIKYNENNIHPWLIKYAKYKGYIK